MCGGWGSEGETDRLIPKPDGKERVCEPTPCCWWDSSSFLCGWSCWDVVWRCEMLLSLVSAVLGPWSRALPLWVPLEASFCCFWKRLTALQFFCVCCFSFELPSFPNIQLHNPGIASNDSRAIASLGLTGDGQGATPGSTKAGPSPKGLWACSPQWVPWALPSWGNK